MASNRAMKRGLVLSAAWLIVFAAPPTAAQAPYEVVHSFAGFREPAEPQALLQAADGTFFRMARDGALTTLHAFAGGAEPDGPAGLVEGSDGNFYGTSCCGGGTSFGGTIFRATPTGSITVLHSFIDPHDGLGPSTLIE